MSNDNDKQEYGPAAPRPDNRPYYIGGYCGECGEALALNDLLNNPQASLTSIWYDEWECPTCRDRIYLDWPPHKLAELISASKNAEDSVEVADFRAEGGYHVVTHPEAFREMMEDPDFPLDDVLEFFRQVRGDDAET